MICAPGDSAAPAKDETLLAFDFGRRRIGVAVGSRRLATASAITTVPGTSQGPDFDAIDQLLREWQPQRLIVGQPLNLDGSRSAMTEAADEFADALRARYSLPVEMIDERHTSIEAQDMIRTARRGGRKRRARAADVDKLAAEVILRSWLDRHGAGQL